MSNVPIYLNNGILVCLYSNVRKHLATFPTILAHGGKCIACRVYAPAIDHKIHNVAFSVPRERLQVRHASTPAFSGSIKDMLQSSLTTHLFSTRWAQWPNNGQLILQLFYSGAVWKMLNKLAPPIRSNFNQLRE